MTKKKKRVYKTPTCPYCGIQDNHLQYSHVEQCRQIQIYQMLKKIIDLFIKEGRLRYE